MSSFWDWHAARWPSLPRFATRQPVSPWRPPSRQKGPNGSKALSFPCLRATFVLPGVLSLGVRRRQNNWQDVFEHFGHRFTIVMGLWLLLLLFRHIQRIMPDSKPESYCVAPRTSFGNTSAWQVSTAAQLSRIEFSAERFKQIGLFRLRWHVTFLAKRIIICRHAPYPVRIKKLLLTVICADRPHTKFSIVLTLQALPSDCCLKQKVWESTQTLLKP